MSDLAQRFVRYSDSVEVIKEGEEQVFDEIAAMVGRLGALMNDRYRHAVRSVHAKSHGLLKGELEVVGGLPGAYAQGLFARAGAYPVVMRFSTAPGDVLADSVSTPRGLAVKVIGVAGEMLPGHVGEVTQDFVMQNAKAFPAPDAASFLKQERVIEANANDPEIFKKAVSNAARGLNAALGLVGLESGALKQLGHPETHVLGETYGTAAAVRYGDHIAKLQFVPASENLKKLTGKHVDVNFHYSGLRDAVVEFFKTETAVWEVQAQLCTDLEKMPVEDPSVEWDEGESPYVTVGRVTCGPQDAYGAKRRVFVDEVLSFNPFHALVAHRPLGNVMRARKKAYAVSSRFRHEMNGVEAREPREVGEVPD